MTYVTKAFKEQLCSLIDGAFWDNQEANGVELDLLPIMECEVADKVDELIELMDAFMEWQVTTGKEA